MKKIILILLVSSCNYIFSMEKEKKNSGEVLETIDFPSGGKVVLDKDQSLLVRQAMLLANATKKDIALPLVFNDEQRLKIKSSTGKEFSGIINLTIAPEGRNFGSDPSKGSFKEKNVE